MIHSSRIGHLIWTDLRVAGIRHGTTVIIESWASKYHPKKENEIKHFLITSHSQKSSRTVSNQAMQKESPKERKKETAKVYSKVLYGFLRVRAVEKKL